MSFDQCFIWRSSFQNDKSRHLDFIQSRRYIHQIDIFSPTPLEESDFANLHNNQNIAEEVYYSTTGKISTLLDDAFLDKILKEKAILLSYNSPLDRTSCFTVTDNGKLFLSVEKEMFTKLGLNGIKRTSHHRDRYEITINLKKEKEKNLAFLKARKCLIDSWDYDFNIVILFPSNKKSTLRHKLKEHKIKTSTKLLKNTNLPELNCRSENFDEDFAVFLEYLGFIACDLQTIQENDDFFCSYDCPLPSLEIGSCLQRNRFVGFLSFDFIDSLLSGMRKILKQKQLPYMAFTAWSLPDSPIMPKYNNLNKIDANVFIFSQENFYTFVVFPDDNYWLSNQITD